MKVIAISQSIEFHETRNERRDYIDQALVKLISSLGYLPVMVPNCLSSYSGSKSEKNNILNEWLNSLSVDGIVLSGGNDIGTCPDRDSTESFLLEYSTNHQLPALGICRGMQIMGVFAGGILEKVRGHVATHHKVMGEFSESVNSYHQLAFLSPPNGYKIMVKSEDGAIEAIRHEKNSWEGWMWHPERNTPFSDNDITRLKRLFG